MEWYYHKDGERLGPLNEAEFQAAIAAGAIMAETLVWNETLPEWQAYVSISGESDELTLKDSFPEPSDGETPETDAPHGETVVCRECGGVSTPDSMAPYGEQWVCSDCKEHFFQKIREGVNIGRKTRTGTGGLTPNSELMAEARSALHERWGLAIGTLLIMIVLGGIAGGVIQGIAAAVGAVSPLPQGVNFLIGSIIGLLVVLIQGPLGVGSARFYINVCDDNDPQVNDLFSGFSSFGSAVSSMLVRTVIAQVFTLPGKNNTARTGRKLLLWICNYF